MKRRNTKPTKTAAPSLPPEQSARLWGDARLSVRTLEQQCGISEELGRHLRAELLARRRAQSATPPEPYPIIVPHEAVLFWEKLQREEERLAANAMLAIEREEREKAQAVAAALTDYATKRKRAARRNGKQGGRPTKEPEKVRAAVREIARRLRDNANLKRLPACRFYVDEMTRNGTPLRIKAERLSQLVLAARRARCRKN